MNPIDLFRSLSLQQRILTGGAVIATLFILLMVARQVSQPSLSLLYADLEPSTAGEVIARLDAMGVEHRVDGGAIYADTSRRDSLRLELAREGLPRQDVVGYELFDGMNSFAMSSDMFDTSYWRAKEGELARSILAMPTVKGARVHIGQAMGRGLRSTRQPATASVTLNSQPTVGASQARAVQYLVALAVPGLQPEDVAVIDTRAGLIAGPGMDRDPNTDMATEVGRAAALKSELLSLLEARVGAGNVRVSVNLDVSTDKVSKTERRFDPNGQVMRSNTVTDRTDSSNGSTQGVTVASNLPTGAAGGGNSQAERSETSEVTSYEISEILTQTETLPGQVKRISVAVLVDEERQVAEDGTTTFLPRSAEELSAIEALTRAAAGLDTTRGDVLRVESMAFTRADAPDMVTGPGTFTRLAERHAGNLAQLALLLFFALGLLIFVVRPLLRARDGAAGDEPVDALGPISLDAPSQDGAQNAAQTALGSASVKPGLPAPDPKAQLEDAVRENTDEAAALLAQWLDIGMPALPEPEGSTS